MNQSHACLECGYVEQACPSCGAPAAIAWPQREKQARPVKDLPSNHASRPKTSPLRWLYGRIGQIICFAAGPLFLFQSTAAYSNALEFAIAGGGFLATGLVLRRQMIDRNHLCNRTDRSELL
jgi:hypothetical protein